MNVSNINFLTNFAAEHTAEARESINQFLEEATNTEKLAQRGQHKHEELVSKLAASNASPTAATESEATTTTTTGMQWSKGGNGLKLIGKKNRRTHNNLMG